MDISAAEQITQAKAPAEYESKYNNAGNGWHKEDPHIAKNDYCSCLENSY